MSQIDIIKAEITDDPLARGYSGMTAAEVAVDMNLVNRSRNRTSMTSSEVLNAVNASDWAGLTDAKKQQMWDVLSIGTINPFGVEATLLIGIFGSGSETIQTLTGLRKEAISRGAELGIGRVRTGYVIDARRPE